MRDKLRFWLLRLLYKMLWKFGQIDGGSDFIVGYYRRYPHPLGVKNENLRRSIETLARDLHLHASTPPDDVL